MYDIYDIYSNIIHLIYHIILKLYVPYLIFSTTRLITITLNNDYNKSVKSKSVSQIFKYFDASTFFELSLSHPKIRKKRQYVVYFQSIGVFILR